MQVEYKGTQYVHKFTKGEEVKYVTCSNENFKQITERPSLEGYEYQYTVGGMVEVATPSKLLGEGETTIIDGNVIVSCIEDNGLVKILTDNNTEYIFPIINEVVEPQPEPQDNIIYE